MVPHWKRRPRFFRKIPFYFAVSLTDQSVRGRRIGKQVARSAKLI